jgi:hypothetical protein
MGCDIHAYIDYDSPEGSMEWINFFGEIHINRNYSLFSVLAGVRDDWENPIGTYIEPKGILDRISFYIKYELSLLVIDDEEYEKATHKDDICSRTQAEHYTKYNKYLGFDGYIDEAKTRVLHPDWHTHSWLTTEELSGAMRKYGACCRKRGWGCAPAEMKAALAAMKALEKEGCKARFIFWFDN